MKRILLLVHHKENARLLLEWLTSFEYQIILTTGEGDELDAAFDLILVDGMALDQLWEKLQARREQEHPQFLPVLFVTARQDLKLVTRHLWQTIDELIVTPTEKTELLARIEILLRARQLSLDLGDSNRKLQHEIKIREQAENRLQVVLKNTENLYTLTSQIGSLRTPEDVLHALTSSGYYNTVSQASIIVFNEPWDEKPPKDYEVLAVLHPDMPPSGKLPQFHPLVNHPFATLLTREQPILIHETAVDQRIDDHTRVMLLELKANSVMLFPLLAGGSWYGVLSFYSSTANQWNDDDVKLVRGLVNQVAVTIDNLRLFAAEAKARQYAEEVSDAKLKFMAMISHELRTPLTSIKGFSTTLLSDDVVWGVEEQHRFLRIIDQETDKVKGLVDQLVDISVIQSGSLRIHVENCFFHEVIKIAAAQLHTITAHHHLKLDIPETLPSLLIDPERIAQVLVNLVNNAVKHSPPATTITISAALAKPHVYVRVIDQGSGIPAENRDVIFEAFRQLDNQPQKTKGIGLGLAICKGLIQAHGGMIWIEDRKDITGTSVVFSLPINIAV